MRQVTITKLFQKNALKSFEFEEVLTTFPSYGVMLKSYNDLNPFMSTELKGGTKGCSIVSIPLSKANSVINYLHKNYSEEIVGSFYKRHPLMIDWETEYWYSSNQQTEGRKKGFEAIKGKPHGWEKLYI